MFKTYITPGQRELRRLLFLLFWLVIPFAINANNEVRAMASYADSLFVLQKDTIFVQDTVIAIDTIKSYTALPQDSILVIPSIIEIEPINEQKPISLYALPYSVTGKSYDWKRLWNNTGVLAAAFVGTLFVMELLPEDATLWHHDELSKVPLFKRWYNHVIKLGPDWDKDKFGFNYILHPYAGAAYFMAARTCGFNMWQSLLYSTLISTVGWEFGVEAFMERPSIQDFFITPIVGTCIGEGFYRVKRYLVNNDYSLLGSKILGNIVAFLVDPVNEFTGLWLGNPARKIAKEKRNEKIQDFSLTPVLTPSCKGFSFVGYF